MTSEEWSRRCSLVTDAMDAYVAGYVCPLSTTNGGVERHEGTGSFVNIRTPQIITCHHVANGRKLNFVPPLMESSTAYHGTWKSGSGIDVALTKELPPAAVSKTKAISCSLCTEVLSLTEKELFYFYGYSGENSDNPFDRLQKPHGLGYLTQISAQAKPDSGLIELIWPNRLEKRSEGASESEKARTKFTNPHGFSGSLVWNTNFVKSGYDPDVWTPSQARVVGILYKFVKEDSLLLAAPVKMFFEEYCS